MAGWRPLKRREFVRKLRALGFVGPYSGTRHQFMTFGSHHAHLSRSKALSSARTTLRKYSLFRVRWILITPMKIHALLVLASFLPILNLGAAESGSLAEPL